jgi:ADP-heptose:LPS heptosyltransferase
LTSTSCSALAQDLLDRCLRGDPPAELPRALIEESCGRSLFGIWIEGLGDRFEPALCDIYARLFAQAIPGADPVALYERYCRVRVPRPVEGVPRRVYVLSRITLGADIAVTSVILDAAKQRFPEAEILLVGPAKNYELFAADPRIGHVLVNYRRGSLRERLAVWDDLKAVLTDGLVLDPDSRLTQLGLLPVCDDRDYHLFESRAYGGASEASLPELAAAWAEETLGVRGARPYLAVPPAPAAVPGIAISLGVGENPAKRLPDPFEGDLLRLLAATGLPITIDQGAGGEESDRVQRAIERSGASVATCDGSFAEFAAIIAASRLYVGYDSAGQHVAAAAGVPLITIFAGFPTSRMFHRWRPQGHVIRVEEPGPDVLAQVSTALRRALP